MVKRYHKKDPHHRREKKKYGTPVPSREYILEYLTQCERPVDMPHLQKAFGITKDSMIEGFTHRIKAMLRDGELHQNRKGHVGISRKMALHPGRVIGHRDGYGFVVTDTPGPDIFLPERDMRAIFSGDRVLVQVVKSKAQGKRLEGKLIEVVQRNTHQLAGRLHRDGALIYVRPDNKQIPQDIIVSDKDTLGAKENEYVKVEIDNQPSKRHSPTGKVVEILGDDLTPGMEIALSVTQYELPCQWSQEVLEQTQHFGEHVPTDWGKNRKDLRSLCFVTIDGADARDFDDAVYCEIKQQGGFKLFVAIADVAHYVKQGSALDMAAQERGNSVYFPGQVIPMLPEVLSNGLCSLKPNVDRLALVCEMDIASTGDLEQAVFYDAVINSKSRLTYSHVARVLEQGSDDALFSKIENLNTLFEVLYAQRVQRGALDFDTTETRIVFNDQQKIEKIVPVVRNRAHRIIEECMLMANVATARHLEKSFIPCLYRVHSPPEQDKLNQLKEFLKLFGLQLGGGNKPSSLDFSHLLKKIENRTDAELLQRVILRTQQQALYIAENAGHFGLGYDGYTHFTSPIRRYPDLIVHRAIKHLIANKSADVFSYDIGTMTELGEHCCMTERRADRATRDALDRLKCDFMQDKVGQRFSGQVVEVTSFGLFIELDSIYVQGLLHISALHRDYYHFDEVHHTLVGKHSGQRYQLTDKIHVLVARVDMEDRKIDFDLADDASLASS